MQAALEVLGRQFYLHFLVTYTFYLSSGYDQLTILMDLFRHVVSSFWVELLLHVTKQPQSLS